MPVNPTTLANRLASNFAHPGPSFAACAQQWADAMVDYVAAMVPPSTTASAAGASLQGALAEAFAAPGGAVPGMEQGFSAFALTLAGGMAPAFTGTPPASQVGFATLFGGLIPTHAAAGARVAGLIHAWFVTGTATPPAGAPIFWK
jgi:hypothetical protein